jgi:hypothetical protein
MHQKVAQTRCLIVPLAFAAAFLYAGQAFADQLILPDGQITWAIHRPLVKLPLKKYFCFSEIQIKLYD